MQSFSILYLALLAQAVNADSDYTRTDTSICQSTQPNQVRWGSNYQLVSTAVNFTPDEATDAINAKCDQNSNKMLDTQVFLLEAKYWHMSAKAFYGQCNDPFFMQRPEVPDVGYANCAAYFHSAIDNCDIHPEVTGKWGNTFEMEFQLSDSSYYCQIFRMPAEYWDDYVKTMPTSTSTTMQPTATPSTLFTTVGAATP